MHDCQKFREDWIVGLSENPDGCEECRRFCDEAAAILQATDGTAQPVPELSEEYWAGFEERLYDKLAFANPGRPSHPYWKLGVLAAAATLATVVTWGSLRAVPPNAPIANATSSEARVEFVDDHIRGLDPMVVDFLGQSELFLRSFTKIGHSDTEDIDDARAHARRDLMGMAEQRKLVGDFAPVRIALDEYESVLREIKNLDSFEDLEDIQKRVQRNGLIANLKAYQPHATLVSQR